MITGAGKESIFVKLELLSKGFMRGMKNVTGSMANVNKKVNAQTHAFSRLNQTQKITRANTKMGQVAQQGFGKTMRMGREEWKKFNEQGRKFNTAGGRLANSFRKSMHGMRGFRMEMLGVMFFGMMLQKAFTGLIKTSLDWMGVMEVFTVALGILFLPVAGLLLEWALKFLDWVSNLTPKQKKLIGTFVLMGAAIGGFLYLIGTFALGIGSLILAFKFLFSPIGAVLGILLALAGVSIYGMFDGLTEEVEGAGQTIATFGITGETLTKVKEKIMSVIRKVIDTIVENFPKILEKGKEILNKIVQGIEDNKNKIAEVLEKIITTFGDWVSDNIQKFIDIGITIGGAIIKGVALSIIEIGKAIGDAFVEKTYPIITGRRTEADLLKPQVTPSTVPTSATGKKLASLSPLFQRPSSLFGALGKLAGFQNGGIVPKTGLILAHKGETVVPANKSSGGIILNVTYNVEISDKEEMERLLRDNNLQLVEEVKRQIAI